MSTNANANEDVKEDFSGLTEVTPHSPHQSHPSHPSQHEPNDLPPRIDVSEEIEKANKERTQSQNNITPHDNVQYVQNPAEHMMMMMGAPQKQQQPSFWKTLMVRGLTILAVVAIGMLIWWWWNSNKSVAEAANDAVQAVGDVAQNVAQKTKRALNLPPLL